MRGAGLRDNANAIAPDAQTSRPEDAGPVRALLGGEYAPAAFVGAAYEPDPSVNSFSAQEQIVYDP